MRPIRVVVNDNMQRGYVYYRTEPAGRNFDEGFEPECPKGSYCGASPRWRARLEGAS